MIHQNTYALRSCKAGGISPYDKTFTWNLEIGGITTAPDWENSPGCGRGLHGFLNGEGRGDLACWDEDAVWLVLRPIGEIVDLDGKIKFKSAETLFVGIRQEAAAYLQSLLGSEDATKCLIIGGTATAGDRDTATAGDRGTATAGYRGTATAGDRGTATAGDSGTATAGDSGTATAGYRGTATAGYRGTATAGDRGTATAGDRGTATAGYSGTATAGYSGTATAGYSGTIVIRWWDGARDRLATGYIGEDGIEPNQLYRVEDGKFVKVADSNP
jgi:hypothetical protein